MPQHKHTSNVSKKRSASTTSDFDRVVAAPSRATGIQRAYRKKMCHVL
jgi:hypothetical protein